MAVMMEIMEATMEALQVEVVGTMEAITVVQLQDQGAIMEETMGETPVNIIKIVLFATT